MTADSNSRRPSRTNTGFGELPKIPEPPDIEPEDIVIAVMGITGAGKTTFVNYLTEHDLKIGYGLEPCTQSVQVVPCSIEHRNKIWLVDTPGFDDTFKTDADILKEVANWLNTAYRMKIKLTGIIYLHRIMDVRVGGVATRNLRMFKKLCGDDGLGSVVLATTMWSSVTSEGVGKRREAELESSPVFWKHMVDHGSKVFRQDKGGKSALEIVQYLIQKRRPVTLDIQREMVDQNMKLGQTGAGSEVASEVEKARQHYEKRLQEIRKELEDAMRERDNERREELEEMKEEFENKMGRGQEEFRKLQADSEQLNQEMKERYEKEIKDLADRIQEKDKMILEAQTEKDQWKRDHEHDLEMEKLKLQMKWKEQYYKMVYATRCIVM
ncbi:hypothetical protein K469DRAFT_684830 [Zopfia rhizophila CBS 207.26]|uniref:G domain-containing protein n=1 Tax=Zopfia rhizophila CBS 207.26 TaxID=1314779 RepID=A0A6A6DBE0_9PEZI|nr:hypothetical protein K469DRAFT_684830 [Zopfia rhizophila CBS 207.26]